MSIIYDYTLQAVEGLKRTSGLVTVKTHTFFARYFDRNSIVIDLGANVGEFSAGMANRFGCSVYAVEAFPTIFAQIPDLPTLKKFQYAIATKDGPIRLFASNNPECGSVHEAVASVYGAIRQQLCHGITLEHFLREQNIQSAELLKIDIEGSEEFLFETTSDETLCRFRQITIEFHDFVRGSITKRSVDKICRRLQALGFMLLPLSYIYPDMATADFLFINTSVCKFQFLDRLRFMALKAVLGFQHLKSAAACRMKGAV